MIVYTSSKSAFLQHVEMNCIGDKVYEEFAKRIGKVSSSEKMAWDNSLRHMYKVLKNPKIANNANVSIEYKLPMHNRRIDVIIAGKDEEYKEHAVIVELKQWTSATAVPGKELVRTIVGHGERDLSHPSYQAWSYAATLEQFNQVVQEDKIALHPCAYMHNYPVIGNDPVVDPQCFEVIREAPIFTIDDTEKLSEFIAKYISHNDDQHIIFRIDGGRIKPSKSLQDAIKGMLQGNREFILLDAQKVVYEEIMHYVHRLQNGDSRKHVFIIEGGPGTGKSVLAVNLLSAALNDDKVAAYVSKNAAPREVYFKKLRQDYTTSYVKNLFMGSGSFVRAKTNDFDLILADEAHRLNAKSGMFHNEGENQIKEIINAARIAVFFIDEQQRVTSYDIGTIAGIKEFAKEQQAKVHILQLDSQFRCNGSDGYVSWLDHALGIDVQQGFSFDSSEFDFKIFDSVQELKKAIMEKNRRANKSRLVAGYCWNWNSKKDPSAFDITVSEEKFNAQWNFSNTKTWAIDDDSIEQIGCIHTCQGLEFDYVGVIIGDDLRCVDNNVICDFSKRAKTDKSLTGLVTECRKKKSEALLRADMIIRNTYKVLMSRGMKGCYIYCTDKKLSQYFKNLLADNDARFEELKRNIEF